MKNLGGILFVAIISLSFSTILSTETATKCMFSENDYANWMAIALYEAIDHPEANVDAGIASLETKSINVKERTMIVRFDSIGDIGWPTVVRGMKIKFIRDDGSMSKPFQYSF